ncbi:MAG TPA: nuclease-related domain-containing protein [Acidimicrobiales bacterium]|nr:nuclease-related domain-containing protein [Acidimicrobiales bacterium]
MLGVHTDERAWRLGGEGERAVAKQLERLSPAWRVLHSIVLSEEGTDLDHLVIGPGAVFCINIKNHPRSAVWVAGATFMVNGQHQPYARASESEATKVSPALTAGCGFDVPVR